MEKDSVTLPSASPFSDRDNPCAAAVLLDRDGTINENRKDHVKSWEEFEFLHGALDALRSLASTPFLIVIVSNQSAIGRHLVSTATVEDIHRRMQNEIVSAGGRVDGVFFCPHRPDEGCSCRKPLPGLLTQASRELGIDLSKSFLVGDSLEDVAAARAAGCTPILVRTGRGEIAARAATDIESKASVVVRDLSAAVEWIFKAANVGNQSEAIQDSPKTKYPEKPGDSLFRR